MQRSQDAVPRHTQAGHPESTKPKPGVDIRAAKGKVQVMCEIKKNLNGPTWELKR
jgi:hypothetical protein